MLLEELFEQRDGLASKESGKFGPVIEDALPVDFTVLLQSQ